MPPLSAKTFTLTAPVNGELRTKFPTGGISGVGSSIEGGSDSSAGSGPGAESGGSGNVIYFADYQTGAQARALGRTQDQIRSDAVAAGWVGAEWPTNGLLHKAWPPNPSINAIGLNYTLKDAYDQFYWDFETRLGTIGVRELFAEWLEYHNAEYTASTTKDYAFACWHGSTPGRTPVANESYQIYGGFNSAGGFGPVANSYMCWQGSYGVNQPWPAYGSSDELGRTNSALLLNGIPFRVKLRIKLNSPGNSDGIISKKLTNLNTGVESVAFSSTNRLLVNSPAQMTIRLFKLGFAQTSPAGTWPTLSERLFRNIILSNYELP